MFNIKVRKLVSLRNLSRWYVRSQFVSHRDADGQAEWTKLVAKAWRISPHMAVHMGERFKYPAVQHELTRLVRSDPKAVIGVSEAIFYLLGDKFDPATRRALQVHPFLLYRSMTDK